MDGPEKKKSETYFERLVTWISNASVLRRGEVCEPGLTAIHKESDPERKKEGRGSNP